MWHYQREVDPFKLYPWARNDHFPLAAVSKGFIADVLQDHINHQVKPAGRAPPLVCEMHRLRQRLEISQCHITHRINYWNVFAIWIIFLIKEIKELFWLTSSLAKSTDRNFIQFVGLLVNCWSCTFHKVQFWPSNILEVTSHNSKSSPSNRVRYIIANHLFPWHNLQADYS